MRGADRNQPCPVCGKKMKECSGHSKKRWVLIALFVTILAMAFFLLYGLNFKDKQEVHADQRFAELRTLNMLQYYINSKTADKWWLKAAPTTKDTASVRFAVAMSDTFSKNIVAILEKHRDISPLAAAIADSITKARATIFISGSSMEIRSGMALPSPDQREVCFIPQDQYAQYRFPAMAHFRSEWRALMIAAIEQPQTVFEGRIMHEAGHALRFLQGQVSATAATYSDANTSEEVEMHELEALVLDKETGGAFFKAVDHILVQSRHAEKSSQEIILGLVLEDLYALDRSLGVESVTQGVAQELAVDYLMAVAYRHIDTTLQKGDTLRRKIDFYNWFRRAFGSG